MLYIFKYFWKINIYNDVDRFFLMLLDKVMKEKNEFIDWNYYFKCYINDLKVFKDDSKKYYIFCSINNWLKLRLKFFFFFLKMVEL